MELSPLMVKVEGSYKPLEGSPHGLAYGGGVLWISYPDLGVVAAFDPSTSSVVKRLALPPSAPLDLAWDGDKLWVADAASGDIYAIDPDTGEIVGVVEGEWVYPTGLACSGDRLYVHDAFREALYSVELETGIAKRETSLAPATGLAYGEGGVWAVLTGNLSLVLLDPADWRVVRTFYCPTPAPFGLAWGGGRLWIADYSSGEILVLNPGERVREVVGRGIPSWLWLVYLFAILPVVLTLLSPEKES